MRLGTECFLGSKLHLTGINDVNLTYRIVQFWYFISLGGSSH